MVTMLKNPKDWTEDDLKALIRDGIEESNRLEYKREINLSDKGKQEACKDVSAFANGQGGTILYGMEEEERKDAGSIPKKIKPITDASIKESLENVLLSGVSPRLHFWIWSISVRGGRCLAVQVPQSASTHMVIRSGENRYYIRRNFQSSRMTEEEVGEHYARRNLASDKARERYYAERTEINTANPTIQLLTLPLVYQPRLVDFREFQPKQFWADGSGFLNPRLSWGYELSANELTAMDMPENWSRIAISCTCEYIDWFDLRGDGVRVFHSEDLFRYLHDLLLHYGRVYATVGYYGPVKIYYRLVNTTDAKLGVRPEFVVGPMPNVTKEEFLHEGDTYVETMCSNPLLIVHEVMDYVWTFFGYEEGCKYFDKDSTLKPLTN
jgi:hypothetical protein